MKIKDFTTGVQHIGIPTNDINKTIEFYHALGFETALRTVNGNEEVAFLLLHDLKLGNYTVPVYAKGMWNPQSNQSYFQIGAEIIRF